MEEGEPRIPNPNPNGPTVDLALGPGLGLPVDEGTLLKTSWRVGREPHSTPALLAARERISSISESEERLLIFVGAFRLLS